MIEPGAEPPDAEEVPARWLLGLFALGLVSQVADSSMVLSYYHVATGVTPERVPASITLLSLLVGEFLVLGVCLSIGSHVFRRYGGLLSRLGLSGQDWRLRVREGLRAFVLSYPFILALGIAASLLGQLVHVSSSQEFLDKLAQKSLSGPLSLALFVLLTAVAAPLTEEILFRGFLYGGLRRKMPPKVAMGLSALVFALLHGATLADLPVFGLGVVLAWLYETTGSLMPGMVLHGSNNAIVLAVLLGGLRSGRAMGPAGRG